MKREDYYSAAYIAVFGGLWGVTEVLLGNILHVLEVPFKGSFLSAIGCTICLVGGYLLPARNRWSIISIGVIAMMIRLLSFGVFKIHIFISMATMVLLMQGVISLLGYNLLGFIIAGVLACLSPYIAAMLFFGIIMGQGILFIYHGILREAASLSFLFHTGVIILVMILLVNIVLGGTSGVLANYCGKRLR